MPLDDDSAPPITAADHAYPPADPSQAAEDDSDQPSPDGAGLTPALQVRATVFRRLHNGISSLGRDRKFSLFLRAFFSLGQVIAFIIVLALTSHDACDRPLRTYLALHLCRVAVSFPLSLYQTLAPRRLSRNEANSPETVAAREARRVLGSPRIDERIRFVSDLFGAFALVLFIVGNYLFWTSSTCHVTSPPLFWSSLAALIFGYFYALEIFLIIFAIVFFLPLVLLILRIFGIGEKKPEIGPLSPAEIDKIPLVLYAPLADAAAPQDSEVPVSAPENVLSNDAGTVEGATNVQSKKETDPNASTTSLASTRSQKAKKGRRRHLIRLFKSKERRHASRVANDASVSTLSQSGFDEYVDGPHPYHPLPANLSTCPICLCDYEDPPLKSANIPKDEIAFESLRLLPCSHVLHKDCVDTWLATSGRCPICQVPVNPNIKKKKSKQSADDPSNNV